MKSEAPAPEFPARVERATRTPATDPTGRTYWIDERSRAHDADLREVVLRVARGSEWVACPMSSDQARALAGALVLVADSLDQEEGA